MNKLTFKKAGDCYENGWEAPGYRIIKRWLKGYVLYHDRVSIATGTRLNEMKQIAREHFQNN